MKRLQQFKEVAKNSQLKELFKTEFANVVGYNIQRNELTNLKTQRKLSLDPMTNPLKESDNFLLGSASIVVLDYIFTQPHADALSDYLAAWSQDPNLYAHKSTVLVFTSDVNLFNETLRRLCYTITIPASTVEERRELLEKVADEITEGFKQKYDEKLNVKINEDIIQASSGLDLHSVETAALESFFLNRQINVPAFTEYKIKILQTYNLSYVVPHIDFSLVGGYELLKQYMRNRVILPLRNPEKAKYYGVGLPRGILLYGIPGTGKSYFTEAIAKELGLPMIKLSSSDLLRGIVGESESRVRQITALIEALAPVTVGVDEIDALAPARGKVMMTDSGVNRRVTNMLLEWLGNRRRQSFLIGATNFLEDIDFAFLRAGRFDEICLIIPPDATARKQILTLHSSVIRKLPLAPKLDLTEIAGPHTFMWTPAELEKLCLDAARTGMEQDAKKITYGHFREALNNIKINVKERQTKIQTGVAKMKELDIVNKGFLDAQLKVFEKGEGDKDRVRAFIDNL